MKTYYFSTVKPICLFSIFILINVLTTSCGSYKNTSYYDNDGIYGNPEVQRSETRPQSDTKDSQYKDYFGSLQNTNEKVEVLTDIDNYRSTDDSNQAVGSDDYKTGYAGWGNNSNPTSINVYDNNWAWNGWNNYFYGPGFGWGWNNWYGMNYGWGWNNWYGPGPGYGYFGWGWNNNYYNGNGYYNNHNYSQGIRGDSYRTGVNRYHTSPRNNPTLRSNNFNNGRTNRTLNSSNRNQNIFSPNRPNQTTTPRFQSPTRSENIRPRNSYPTRSEQSSPREYSSPRSYDGGGRSSGGGGFGGGGRSGSGNGNGRR